MDGWMEKQVEERQKKDRKKYAQKTNKQRNISIENEKNNAIFYMSPPNFHYSTNQYSLLQCYRV
jgi:hypothetical protein